MYIKSLKKCILICFDVKNCDIICLYSMDLRKLLAVKRWFFVNKKDLVVNLTCLIISAVSGLVTKDLLVGGVALLTALLASYYASTGKKINYIMGFINSLLIGLVSYKNDLFGLFFFNVFVFAPLQIKGYLSWNKNTKAGEAVKVREFTFKNSIVITASCVLGSFLVGYILSLIPNQRLALMDAASNCINLCAVILMILRYRECWWLWLFNNTIDLGIWALMVLKGGEGSTMMLLVAIGYLLINVYGIIRWNMEARKNRKKKAN